MFLASNDLEATITFSQALAKLTFPLIVYFSTIEICLYSFYGNKVIARLVRRQQNDKSRYIFIPDSSNQFVSLGLVRQIVTPLYLIN